ncbi:HAD family hydrolase [Atopobacter phocae]|uniref:HAD family hydrolase n=1 Tax=Atopobacter phocae TaxID=136492 RepID=UPI0004702D3F|nr:HAD family hydrolase [Atopobacter phocae]
MRGAIFDADGTLFDSMAMWDNLAAQYLKKQGIQPAINLKETLATQSLDEGLSYLIETYQLNQSRHQLATELHQMMEAFYQHDVQLKPGVKDLLSDLKEQGVAMCIATASDRSLIEQALNRCGIQSYFSAIVTEEMVGASKQSSLIYREALTYLKTTKQDTWVFEDALHAIKTATADGFKVIGVFDASEARQTEVKQLATKYITSFEAWEVRQDKELFSH